MHIFYDLLIIVLLAPTLVLIILFLRHIFYLKKSFWHRFPKISGVLLVFFLIFFIVISWGSFLEPQIIVVKNKSYDLGLKTPVRLVLIADAQLGPYKKEYYLQKIINRLQKIKPDFILYAGDFVMNEGSSENHALYWNGVQEFASRVPFIGVFGNHEYGFAAPTLHPIVRDVHDEAYKTLKAYGVNILKDEEIVLDVKDQKIRIVGLDDLWSKHNQIKNIEKQDVPTIVLSHNPDVVYYQDPQIVQLVLAAHTHGGQVRLPFFGPLGDANTLLPRAFYKGATEINGIPLYVTSGLGESGARSRLFNLPEIVVLEVN